MAVFFILVSTLCVFPVPFPLPGADRQESISELRWKVGEQENELYAAQTALAYSRARLAMAEGKYATAVENWRKVLAPYEERLKVAERLAPGTADGGEGLLTAQCHVANIRAYLAEAERKPDVMVTELQKVIAMQKKRVTWLKQWAGHGPEIMEQFKEELKRTAKELLQASSRLEAGKRWLETTRRAEQKKD